MRQITKFEELPEELREHPFYDREQAWIACYNTGLSDGGKRPPLTEVPEHVLKALANVAGAWDIKQILAALNADRAGEQPVKTPAPAAAAEPKNICEKCHGEGWYNPLDGGDCVNCQECGGTGKAASPQVIHMPKYAGKPRLDTSCPAPASEPKELKQIATMLATPFHDLVALVSPAPAADMQQLRNVAAWAVHHHAYGGIHDSKSILKGNADRRIKEAAAGDLGKSAPDPEQDCKCPVCSPAPAAEPYDDNFAQYGFDDTVALLKRADNIRSAIPRTYYVFDDKCPQKLSNKEKWAMVLAGDVIDELLGNIEAPTPAPAAEPDSKSGLSAELSAMDAYDEIENQTGTDDEFAAAESPLLKMLKQPTTWTEETLAFHESLICLIAALRKRGGK